MKASDDAQGMTDEELRSAILVQGRLADSYQRLAAAHQRAADAYASRGGWLSGRGADVITYCRERGERCRVTVSP